MDYPSAGVNTDKADLLVDRIRNMTPSHPRVKAGIGPFAAIYDIGGLGGKRPFLVSSTDGVGTKLKVALAMNDLSTVGIDLVAMCVNDVITTGATPLFFLDYYKTTRLDVNQSEILINGIQEGCRQAGCILIGGETAEHPHPNKETDIDLAGFCVGIVDESNLITGQTISIGDSILGVASNGVHSNGYSLLRSIFFDTHHLNPFDVLPPLAHSLGTELLKPTFIYTSIVQVISKQFIIKGIAHITGGGIPGNLSRIIPRGLAANITTEFPIPPIFSLIQKYGAVSDEEMARVFNLGMGLVIVVDPQQKQGILDFAKKNSPIPFFDLGTIRKDDGKQSLTFPFIVQGTLGTLAPK